MASRYSVIQYVPDPIADERINIGLVIFDDEQVKAVFLKQWDRVRCFAMEDIQFLRLFEEQMQHAAAEGLVFPGDRENGQPVAWMIADVRAAQLTVPIGILMLPLQPKTFEANRLYKLYEQKKAIYERMGAIVLGETEIQEWATEQLKEKKLVAH